LSDGKITSHQPVKLFCCIIFLLHPCLMLNIYSTYNFLCYQ
jgi:hypothetical protein